MVARGAILALALLLAPVTVGARFTVFLAAPAPVPGDADTRPGDGVTQRPVLTLAAVTTVGAPVDTVTSARAVGAPPPRLALAGAGGHTAAMNTLLCTVGDAHLPTLIKARAALGLATIHGLLSPAVGCPVAYPVSCALEPVEDVRTAGIINLIKGMCI